MRNVIVTGGTRGLGLATAARLSGNGYRVIAVARAEPAYFARVREEAGSLGELCFAACDLSVLDGIRPFVSSIVERFGPVYGLVNNAGIGTGGVLAAMPVCAIEDLVRLNVTVPLVLTKAVLRSMMAKGGGGRIVNISSIVASAGFSGLSAYSATKAALEGMARSLAREVGPLQITVNCVAPGFVSTEMTKDLSDGDREKIIRRSALRRLAEPENVAAAVAYLLSEDARNVTGTVLTVDAGNTA